MSRYRYQLDNHLGTVAVEVDEVGNVISYEEYHPYGTSAYRAAGGAVDVSARRYRYTGKERDEETGLYYHGARYYAAWLGRWTAADPSGMVDGANLFQYVRGNPIALSDPDGRRPKADGIRANELENRFWRGAGDATLKRGIMGLADVVKAAAQGDHIERKSPAARERDDEVADLVDQRAEQAWQGARNQTVSDEEVAAGESALLAVDLTLAALDLTKVGVSLVRMLRNVDDVAKAGAKARNPASRAADAADAADEVAETGRKASSPHVKPGTATETAEDLTGARPPYGAPPPRKPGVGSGAPQFEDLRSALDAGKKRTVASATVSIDGTKIDIVSVSGEASRGTKLGDALIAPVTTRTGPGRQDAEVKILDYLASRLNSDSTGTIDLVVDNVHGVCKNCTPAIFRFREKFPHVRLNVSLAK